MKLIYEPEIFIIGKQQLDFHGVDNFLDYIGVTPERCQDIEEKSYEIPSGEALAEIAGRLCYQSFQSPRPGGNEAYLKHILEVGHGSVLEHAVFNFIFTGISRSLTHELIRHRHMSYSQLSQRFYNESDAAMVVPPALVDDVRNQTASGIIWLNSVCSAIDSYKRLLMFLSSESKDQTTAAKKSIREAARSVLPNATETMIFVTANVRAIRNFLEQRGSYHADAEIRRLAIKLCGIMKDLCPVLFHDFEEYKNSDGVKYISSKFHKV